MKTEYSEVPDLDAMTRDELMAFWNRFRRGRKAAAKMFGHTKPGYTNVAATLASYAVNKAVAMSSRLGGDIDTAIHYESMCELIYARLPEYARW